MSKWQHVASKTASSSASLAFTAKEIDANTVLTVSGIAVVLRALVPANNTVTLNIQVSTAGAVDTGSNYAFSNWGAPFSTGTGANQGNSAAAAAFILGAVAGTAGAGFGTAGRFTILSPFVAVTNKSAQWQCVQTLTATTGVAYSGGGTWANTAAIDGLSIAFSAGNISTGSADVFLLIAQ
jgi:hypothetical protein